MSLSRSSPPCNSQNWTVTSRVSQTLNSLRSFVTETEEIKCTFENRLQNDPYGT